MQSGQWRAISPDVRGAYVKVLRDPDHAHAICEEYRAAGIDRAHDGRDREAARKIQSPVLVVWSAQGPLDSWYAEGPLAVWRDWADDASGYPLEGGHFFPEAAPEQTAEALRRFFNSSE
jgi:haloacetate dehalogenase